MLSKRERYNSYGILLMLISFGIILIGILYSVVNDAVFFVLVVFGSSLFGYSMSLLERGKNVRGNL